MVREYAVRAVQAVMRGQSEVDSVYNRVKTDIEFRGEFSETLQSPEVTLQLGAGDCDDHVMLMSAVLMSLGFKTRFKTISTPSDPANYSHVYLEVQDRQTHEWIALDSTVGQAYAGWEPPHAVRSKNYRTMSADDTGDVPPLVEILIGLGVAWAVQKFFSKGAR